MITEEKVKRLKRIHHKEKISQIRKIYRELFRLEEQERKLPWLPLEKPIQNGFKKFFVLRNDIANRQDAHVFKQILGVINKTIYSRDQEFTLKRRRRKLYRNHRGQLKRGSVEEQLESIPHYTKVIGKGEWEKLDWPNQLTKWFTGHTTHLRMAAWGNTFTVEGRDFVYPYFFETKVEPHFLTHYQQADSDLETRIAEIRHRIRYENLWPIYWHIAHGDNGDNDDEWYTPIGVVAASQLINHQTGLKQEAQFELNETYAEKHFLAYLENRYGLYYEPFNDPTYVFEEVYE